MTRTPPMQTAEGLSADLRDGAMEIRLRGYITIPHVMEEAADRLSALTAENERLRGALSRIADESVFNQMRFADEDDTDYFLRGFGAVKGAARLALSTPDEGAE